MLTGELRNKIDAIWNCFWSGGLSNPLQVIEQIVSKARCPVRFTTTSRLSRGSDRRSRDRSLQGNGMIGSGVD
jgi:hypothetical protein